LEFKQEELFSHEGIDKLKQKGLSPS